MRIKVDNRDIKEVDRFKYLGSLLTRDGYLHNGNYDEVRHAFNRKISLLTRKAKYTQEKIG